jgi:hypothetical protein
VLVLVFGRKKLRREATLREPPATEREHGAWGAAARSAAGDADAWPLGFALPQRYISLYQEQTEKKLPMVGLGLCYHDILDRKSPFFISAQIQQVR